MILVRITMHARPEKQKELVQTVVSMVEPTGREKGCRSYEVFSDIEDKNVFTLIEEWETRDDLKSHLRSDRFGVLLGTKSLLWEPPQIQIHTVSHSEGMEAIHAARNNRI
jgi:quinol monooxygenase YgiN